MDEIYSYNADCLKELKISNEDIATLINLADQPSDDTENRILLIKLKSICLLMSINDGKLPNTQAEISGIFPSANPQGISFISGKAISIYRKIELNKGGKSMEERLDETFGGVPCTKILELAKGQMINFINSSEGDF